MEYIRKILHSRCTPNNVNVKFHNTMDPWSEDYSHWNYKAAKIAMKQVISDIYLKTIFFFKIIFTQFTINDF